MRPRSHTRSIALVGLVGALAATACGGDAGSMLASAVMGFQAPVARAASTSTPTPTPAPTSPPLAAPLVVQVENHQDARPQSGLGEADVVYEYETEGGISRFSTVFFKPPVVAVGPVRSARIATVKLVKIWNATLVYSGSVPYILGLIQQGNVRFKTEEPGGPLFRINSRAAPHNLYTDGAHLSALAQQVGPAVTTYQLWPRTSPTALPAGATVAGQVNVVISNYEQPHFTYDPPSGGYVRSEPNTGVLHDAATGKPWSIPTIVVLQVPVSIGPEVEDGCCTHGLDFGVVGSGPAQVMVGGWSFTGTYTQAESGPPMLKLADGSPMPIAPGQVLVILLRQGNLVTAA